MFWTIWILFTYFFSFSLSVVHSNYIFKFWLEHCFKNCMAWKVKHDNDQNYEVSQCIFLTLKMNLFFFQIIVFIIIQLVTFICRSFSLCLCKQTFKIFLESNHVIFLFSLHKQSSSHWRIDEEIEKYLAPYSTNDLFTLRRHLRPSKLGFQTLGKFYGGTAHIQKAWYTINQLKFLCQRIKNLPFRMIYWGRRLGRQYS